MAEFQSTVEYRGVLNFPGYRVGADGSVWSCWVQVPPPGKGRRGFVSRLGSEWHLLSPTRLGRYGYCDVCLRRDGRGHHRLVHRLVLEAFVGPCPPGHETAHGDGDTSNNRLDNLRWATPTENQADRLIHGTDCRGEKHGNHKLTAVDVVQILDEWANDFTVTQIARGRGVSRRTISRIVGGNAWRHVTKNCEPRS